MGTVLPDNPAAQLEFFQVHAQHWSVDPPAIGLSDALAAEVAAATARAAAAFAAAQVARQAARSATRDWEDAAASLRELGGNAINVIKAFARASDDPGVLIAASIAPPGRPGPKRRSPDEADAALPHIRTCSARPNAFGGVEVEWTCGMGATMGAGSGMMYRVHRSLDRGPSTLIEVVGSPGAGRRTSRFTDTTVPTGTRTAEYFITPMRGSATGEVGLSATVQFGGNAGAVGTPRTTIRQAA